MHAFATGHGDNILVSTQESSPDNATADESTALAQEETEEATNTHVCRMTDDDGHVHEKN